MTLAVEALPAEDYFVDPVMGYKVEKGTARLILAFFALGFLLFGLGAVAALGVVLTRAPSITLLNPYWFYTALTFHGVLMLTMWVHTFEAGLWIYTSTVLLKQKMWLKRWGWVAFALILVGQLIVLGAIASGEASVMYTTYVPLRPNVLFYIGHVVYAVGLILVVALFGLNLVKARADGTYPGSIPLVTYGMGISAIIAFVSIISAIIAFVPATLWALGVVVERWDTMAFKLTFWGMGHTLQYTNITSMVVVWYAIVALALRGRATSDKFSRYAFMLYMFTTLPVWMHHFQVDPPFDPALKWWGATFTGILLGIPSMMHGIAVPAAAEKKLRTIHKIKTRFGFLRKWGWRDPAMVGLFFSLVLFAIGGFDGTAGTTNQLNLILHDTMWLPAHIHGTLAGGTAVAFMALSWYLLPALGIKVTARRIWGNLYAYLAGIGFLLLLVTMHIAGFQGVPRRTATITYTDLAELVPNWFWSMDLMAVGGALAGVAVLTFVVVMLISIFRAVFPERAIIPRPELAPAITGGSDGD